jgi:hypothetical protein
MNLERLSPPLFSQETKVMNNRILWPLVLIVILAAVEPGFAQTTEFTYQGRVVNGSVPPSENYDFEFRLFSVETGGSAISTVTRSGVVVSNGVFTVKLDFGGQFNGTARWLEIAAKTAGSLSSLTTLSPRQQITSSPYSIRSLTSERSDVATNSLQLGGTNASQYVVTTDPRLSDSRNPLPNSASYVQNTTTPQISSNFNISGNGTVGGSFSADNVNATTQFKLGSNTVVSSPGTNNFYVGLGNAPPGTSAVSNSFFGINAGRDNQSGNRNSFFGQNAGRGNSLADDNAFFGYQAGINNNANNNSFFGSEAGADNVNGDNNSFFGRNAGANHNDGNGNSFFGNNAGVANIESNGNSFFGNAAGSTNTPVALILLDPLTPSLAMPQEITISTATTTQSSARTPTSPQ